MCCFHIIDTICSGIWSVWLQHAFIFTDRQTIKTLDCLSKPRSFLSLFPYSQLHWVKVEQCPMDMVMFISRGLVTGTVVNVRYFHEAIMSFLHLRKFIKRHKREEGSIYWRFTNKTNWAIRWRHVTSCIVLNLVAQYLLRSDNCRQNFSIKNIPKYV